MGYWGGGLEFGDTVDKTIHREIKEEYSTNVLSYQFLGYRDAHRMNDGKRTHWIALDFKVRINPKQVKIGEPHKFDEIGWFRLDKLPKPVCSQFPTFLKLYWNKLV